MNDELQTVTIFRTWVQIAASLRSDAERGKLYHALCEYSLYGTEPKLEEHLQAFFTLMRPSIDKSNRRKKAQQKGVQNRLQSKLQTDLQTDLQNGLQNSLQTELQTDLQTSHSRARKTETGTEKKGDTKVSPKEKPKKPESFWNLLPDHLLNQTVAEKWKEWEDYRRKRGKSISEAAARKQMKMLSELTQEEAIAAIDQSIANDYQGLFPPRRKVVTLHKAKDLSGI